MRTFLFTLVLCLCFSAFANSQDTAPMNASRVPDNVRFEIVQPSFDRDTTFRLDKFSGQIFRLTTCPHDDSFGSRLCWKEMQVIDRPRGYTSSVNYQIVILNPQKLIFLLRLDSGAMWHYGVEPNDRWYPFNECSDRVSGGCQWKIWQ